MQNILYQVLFGFHSKCLYLRWKFAYRQAHMKAIDDPRLVGKERIFLKIIRTGHE